MTPLFTSLAGTQVSKEKALENPARREKNWAKKIVCAIGFCWNLCSRFRPLAHVLSTFPSWEGNFRMSSFLSLFNF